MGYEIAEQLNWQLPNVIIYPAGGGTGIVCIWKAFKEMKEMGWLSGPLPRMIAVQSTNCAPVLDALNNSENWKNMITPGQPLQTDWPCPTPLVWT